MELTKQKCEACEGGIPPFTLEEIKQYLPQLKLDWQVLANQKLERIFKFKNFVEAVVFVNQVAALAEAEGHHPNIYFTWGKCNIELWTHAVNGLSENDFILAAKIDLIK